MITAYENIDIPEEDWKKINTLDDSQYAEKWLVNYAGRTLWKKQENKLIFRYSEVYLNFIYNMFLGDKVQSIWLVNSGKNTILAIEMQKNFIDLYKFYNHMYPVILELEIQIKKLDVSYVYYENTLRDLEDRKKKEKTHDFFETDKGLEEILFMSSILEETDLKGLDSWASNVGVVVDSFDNILKYFRIDLDQSFNCDSVFFIVNHHPIFLTHVDLLEYAHQIKRCKLGSKLAESFKENMVKKSFAMMKNIYKNKDYILKMLKEIETVAGDAVLKKKITQVGNFNMYAMYYYDSFSKQEKPQEFFMSDCVMQQIETYNKIFDQTVEERLESFLDDIEKLIDFVKIQFERNSDLQKECIEKISSVKDIVQQVLSPKHSNQCLRCGKPKFN